MSHPPILRPPSEPFRPGDELANPRRGERAVLVKAPTSGDPSLEADLHIQPGGGPLGEHRHAGFDERFTVVAGRIGFRLEERESIASRGESVTFGRGRWHDWWNAGEEVAVARVWISDGRRFGPMIETVFGLAADGHANSRGLPDPLQLALIATEFADVIEMRRPPRPLQRALLALLCPLARARGYRATYPQYGRSLIDPTSR